MVAPNIEGTYQLVRRELPDGTVQFPPAMIVSNFDINRGGRHGRQHRS